MLLAVGGIGLLSACNRSTTPDKMTLTAARNAFKKGDHEQALAICAELLKKQKDSSTLLLMAGESASRLKRYEVAIQLYDRVSDSSKSDASTARWAAGEVSLQLGRMSETIVRMEQALALDAGNERARERLIYLLNLAGRRWDASPHLLKMVRQGKFSAQQLLYLGNIAKSVENEKELSHFLSAAPNDRLPLLGLARIRLREGALDECKRLLTEVLNQSPNLVEAHVQLGKLLLQSDPQQINSWNRSLPINAELHPDIWFIRGEWARDHGQLEAAARCFAESLHLDPDHLAALNALAQVSASLGNLDQARATANRAAQLEKLLFVFERIMADEWSGRQALAQRKMSEMEYEQYLRSKGRLEPIVLAAQQTLELGRAWESMAWNQYGLSVDPLNRDLQSLTDKARPLLDRRSTRTHGNVSVVDSQWMQSLKLPVWELEKSAAPLIASLPEQAKREVRFTELDGELDFTYYASRTSFEDGRRMFEITGGGVGVLDYDRDGWPDLFLAQGSDWPSDGTDQSHSDRLKRNRGWKDANVPIFDDVTNRAGIEENAFGQGVAIGDVDSDGFDDIYVCNFGVNQLWINQGDGTFREGSAMIAVMSASWTVSAAIADLNGDGLAEIYDANYVEGEDVATRRCLIEGKPRACSPLNFRKAKGRLLAVDEKGIFRDVSPQVLSPSIQEGNALGLAIFRLHNHQLPSIFVANDQVANMMLTAEPDVSSPLHIRFVDNAMLNGLAYDGDGKAQACMGIAIGDVNHDGAIDLLVTNYYDESNTLYLQQSGGIFRDATRASGLVKPSVKMLGFGTQFIDARCDGIADLIVLNGHIDDMSHKGTPFRMRAQFFVGDGQGKFVEDRSPATGAYFAKERLGRALALVDFDRDGRQDFVATDLERPASLVRNESESGNFLSIRFVGTQSHRDAVGTEVVATVSGRQSTHQLVAGYGYMASNEKVIHIGLGDATMVERLDIHWPSGIQQTHTNVPANSHCLAIENHVKLAPILPRTLDNLR